MESLLKQLQLLSEQFLNELDTFDVDQIDHYMMERDKIFAKIIAVDGIQLNQLFLQKIIDQDKVIMERFSNFLAEASKELTKLRQAQSSRNKYEPDYDMMASDEGLFLDYRK